MKFTRNFKDVSKVDVPEVGGKGASLGEMTQVGIPVPPGFVVLADAFERFLEETDLNVEIASILNNVDIKKIHTVDNASEKIKALILSAEIPKIIAKEIKIAFKKLKINYVAVRSSATAEDGSSAAWAGQLESYLNTTEKTLLENVKKCWASLFTPRAIFYRFEKKLHKQKISVAVVVQKMIESEVSGIAFSVHPVTQDRNQLIIEAGFGLGEAIVGGEITPDSYVVEKNSKKIIDININVQNKGLYRAKTGGNEWKLISRKIGGKQVLSNKQILQLSELILKIENHYGFPVDVEWAFEKGKFYIVQSRPITTLSPISKESELNFINKKISSKYEPIFKLPYSNVFMNSITFAVAYKDYDSVAVIREGRWELFMPFDKIENVAEERHKEVLSGLDFDEFKKRSLLYMDEVFDLDSRNMAEMNNRQFIKFLDKVFLMGGRFFKIYKDTEFFNFTRIEKELGKFVENKYSFDEVLSGRVDFSNWPKKERLLAEYMINMQHLKFKLRALINKVWMGKRSFPARLFEQISLRTKREDALSMTIQEIKKCIVGDKINNVHERHICSVIFYDKNKKETKILVGDRAHKKIKELEKEVPQKILGTIAYKGVVRGRVKIIPLSMNPEKYIGKMEQGDILVSDTTGPEMMIAIKKASAIITDEGGLMSHAAIVAREFKIPCIVGTKYGTLILKDGDLVEVDANEGVVRILKR